MVRGKPRRTKKNLINNKTPDWLRAREALRLPAEEYPAVLLLIGFDRRCFYSADLGADTEAGQRCALYAPVRINQRIGVALSFRCHLGRGQRGHEVFAEARHVGA